MATSEKPLPQGFARVLRQLHPFFTSSEPHRCRRHRLLLVYWRRPPPPPHTSLSGASHPGHRAGVESCGRRVLPLTACQWKPDLISGNHRIISFSSCRLIPIPTTPPPSVTLHSTSSPPLLLHQSFFSLPFCLSLPSLHRYLNMSLYLRLSL